MKPKIIRDISEIETEIDQIQDDLYNSQVLPHTQSSSIQSLPTGTVDGVVGNVEINGLSLVNGVVNGDFSDGTTGWIGHMHPYLPLIIF